MAPATVVDAPKAPAAALSVGALLVVAALFLLYQYSHLAYEDLSKLKLDTDSVLGGEQGQDLAIIVDGGVVGGLRERIG